MGIHPLLDIRLCEKTGKDENTSFPRRLLDFAESQKQEMINREEFDKDRDKMIIVFDGDIFEEKVHGYDDLIRDIEKENIAAVSNPGFELFLLLHYEDAYDKYIFGKEKEFLKMDENKKYSHAYNILRELTGMNPKKNKEIGLLADKVFIAIDQEKKINQDIHNLTGNVSSNIGAIIESIIQDAPNMPHV